MSLTVVPDKKTENPKENDALKDAPKHMSKFAAYLKEREGIDLIETEWGFAIYALGKTECYIRDIFVYPEHRRGRGCYDIADEICKIAKEAGCTMLTGSVCPTANGATISLQVLLGYGMRLHSVGTDRVIFIKDL